VYNNHINNGTGAATMEKKVFHLKGKTIKSVPAHPYNKGNGQIGYTDNWKIANAFNKRFGAPVIPARETFEGCA
jgi:hypothetical protein